LIDRWRSLFDAALSTGRPMIGLRDVVVRVLQEGAERDAVWHALDDYREELRGSGREQDEDTVLEVCNRLGALPAGLLTTPHSMGK
jgi:hypothetical protein